MKFTKNTISVLVAMLSLTITVTATPLPSNATGQKKSTTSQTSKNSQKQRSSKKSQKKQKSNTKNATQQKRKQETSADVKKQHQATQREIRLTEEQIRENDKSIKKNVADLTRIDADINVSKQQINGLSQQLGTLDRQLSTYSSEIADNEATIARMRNEYLAAVKKMRLSKTKSSPLAFVFSSGSFNQAVRRMRYLKRFSEWRDRQTEDLRKRVADLKYKKELLAQTRSEKDRVLSKEVALKRELENQHARQNALVADLRKNGEALQQHLARKQAEANEMRSRISALIAEEQRRAEEAERKRKEQERIAQEKAAQEKSRREAEEVRQRQEDLAQNKDEGNKKQEKKKETKKKTDNKSKSKTDSKDYAQARQRKSRSDKADKQESKKTESRNTGTGGFASAKGSLPRPVTGAFRVTSPFGRHSLPDLPDVMYDNPGIDAEVSPGASAMAVYAGKVSGVYVLKGFSTVIIVNHGDYYTVYGNIASPAVSSGAIVKQGQNLGKIVSDPEDNNRTIIHFEIWHGREKLNPMQWIR